MRTTPPAHYLMKVQSFSLLSKSMEKHESSVFEVGGYKWVLSFYSNTSEKYLSLYLTIICSDDDAESTTSDDVGIIPSSGWEVNANFTLFVYNQTKDNYLTFQAVRRFHEMKKEWGFERIMLLETSEDVNNGYVVNDTCVFGAEIFIINHTAPTSAILSVVDRHFINNSIFRWEIKEFSDKYIYKSQVFCSGGIEWHLTISPNGIQSRDGKSLAIFLTKEHPKNSTTYAEFCVRIINHLDSKHKEYADNEYFSRDKSWNCTKLISLEDLHNFLNYYIVKDTLILQLEFFLISHTKVLTSSKSTKMIN
ncbi:uncharacterized protein LOC133038090 [Cannabis sativa]|uniref:uncharacterized protein LOC133038090 n=1 Tax=Cannabis sativa TaxID=3483 RepID=UPI0029CA6845|nr:uncharacterized protein LOC133038090 [Cannabis sativa]